MKGQVPPRPKRALVASKWVEPTGTMLVPCFCLLIYGLTWAQYVLDDDIEHYNHAEPATTKCPLLPGQPVNVLQVPVILPDSRTHGRGDSVSSQKLTMNPEDKYLNPREPPKPKPRLRTSPGVPQQATFESSLKPPTLGAAARSTSQPPDAGQGKADSTRHGTSSKGARSVSPPRSRGLGSAFHSHSRSAASERTSSASGHVANGYGYDRLRTESNSRGRDRQASSHSNGSFAGGTTNSQSTERLPHREPVPAASAETAPLSIQDRRAQRSRSREPSPQRNVLTLETRPGQGKSSNQCRPLNKHPPRAKEFFSKQKSRLPSKAKMLAAMDPTTPKPWMSKEKRLPTLPNSPSSVMDEAVRDLDAHDKAMDLEKLQSRFSEMTVADDSTTSNSPCERSRFSEWSTDSDAFSPESTTSSPTFKRDTHIPPTHDEAESTNPSLTPLVGDYSDPATPHLLADSKSSSPTSVPDQTSPIDISVPQLTVAEFSPDLDISGLAIEGVDQLESNPKRHAAFLDEVQSVKALKSPAPSTPMSSQTIKRDMTSSHQSELHQPFTRRPSRQSVTMQELMNELSYLKTAIGSGTDVSI